MKLSKTESQLLERLESTVRKCVHIVYYSGHGPQGGKISGGFRELKAAKKLEEKGLVRLVRLGRYAVADSGYTVWHNEYRIETPSSEEDRNV